jgi:hypothetical protein
MREFRRKWEERCRNTAQAVIISEMSPAEMQKVKEGLVDLFKTEINSLMKEFPLTPNDRENWLAFEGAYEEAMHRLRLHIMRALKRKSETMYGQ